MFKRIITLSSIYIFISSCATNPVTGKQTFNLMSESQENRQGQAAYQEILKKEKETNNRALANQIAQIGRRLAAVSGRPDLQWEFKTLESNTPNAFCLPGGKVAIYTGILKFAQNEAGLAAIMGHEIGHALARHGGQRVSQHIGVGVAMAAVGALAYRESGDHQKRNALLAALGVGATLGIILPYSRSHETEADEIGLKLMARAGYDPNEAPRFWERFSKVGGKKPPEFLSTHPSSENRANNLRNLVPSVMTEYQSASVKYGRGPRLKM